MRPSSDDVGRARHAMTDELIVMCGDWRRRPVYSNADIDTKIRSLVAPVRAIYRKGYLVIA